MSYNYGRDSYGSRGYSSYGGGRDDRFRDGPPVYFPSQLNNSGSGSRYHDMHKSRDYGGRNFSSQEQRRRELLDKQRERRNQSQNQGRNLPKDKKKGPKGPPPKPREFKDVLSYSEYFVERPEDLEQWIVVACPKGKRCCLVAHKGTTIIYDKSGKEIDQFMSNIPGGCDPAHLPPSAGANRKSILDCVYVEQDKTFYVIDILMWNMCCFIECETSLRFFWLQTRLEEVEVQKTTKTNWFKIKPAIRFNCPDSQEYLSKPFIYPDNSPKTDGFLFYHPESIYESGTTPLVGWLNGYMIPEVIPHLELHPSYLEEKPANYKDLISYVEEHGNSYGQKKKKKSSGKQDGESSMDVN